MWFDRFRQADASSTRSHSGLGLGLAIVRHLIELHGGTVAAKSEGEGRGAIFEVTLPVPAVGSADRASGPARADQPDLGPDQPSLQGLHVLVVDDDDDARELVSTVLQKSGARVAAASSAAQALEVLASSPVYVIVSDIGMPAQDGYSLIRSLRSEAPDAARSIPALALTAFARVEDRLRATSAGFQQYASKPIDPRALVRTVAALAAQNAIR